MIVIERYGIKLRSLQEEDLEEVRQWRNAEHIRDNMEYRKEITPEMQKSWFANLDKTTNFYFVIEQAGEKIGLVNSKEIDWAEKEAEGGIFLGVTSYHNSFVPVTAVLAMMEIMFSVFGMEKYRAKIKATNQKTINFNLDLGYRIVANKDDSAFHHYKVNREQFFEGTKKIRAAATRISSGHSALSYDSNEAPLILGKLQDFVPESIPELNIKVKVLG